MKSNQPLTFHPPWCVSWTCVSCLSVYIPLGRELTSLIKVSHQTFMQQLLTKCLLCAELYIVAGVQRLCVW